MRPAKKSAFYGQDAAALFAAVKEDFFAGRIGVRRVGEERNHGSPDESLLFTTEDTNQGYYSIRIAIQDGSTSTLAALEEMADRAVTGGSTQYDTGYYE